MTIPLGPSLFRRTLGWFLLAALGNLAIGALAIVINTPPMTIPPSATMEFLYPFVAPMYAPELLLFTSLLSALSGLRMVKGETGDDEAARLIAWAVRLALAIVLSFAIVVITVAPHRLAVVLFAVLLGFVTFVLAEHLVPPASITPEQRLETVRNDLNSRRAWARAALGDDWEAPSKRRIWPRFIVFAVVPVVLQTAAGAVISRAIWGPEIASTPGWIAVCALTSYGLAILTSAWLAGADKAESPQRRAWLSIPFMVLGAGASVAFASVFFFQVRDAAPLAWLILGMSAGWALILWWPSRAHRLGALIDLASYLTKRHLDRTEARASAITGQAGAQASEAETTTPQPEPEPEPEPTTETAS